MANLRKKIIEHKKLVVLIVILTFMMIQYQSPGSKQAFGGPSGCAPQELASQPSSSYTPPYSPPEEQSIVNIYLTDAMCTMQYEPVCSGGITYPNPCVAEMMGKTEYTDGVCTNMPSITCEIIKGTCSETCGDTTFEYKGTLDLCTTGKCCIPKTDILEGIPSAIKTTIVKVELYGPDGWITVYEGTIPIELSDENTQQIVSEKIREGIYTKIRITWGGTLKIIYQDGTEKLIEFKERVWEFDIPNINAIRGKMNNLMIDIPMEDSLDYESGRIIFNPTQKFEYNIEERFELNKEDIGKYLSDSQLHWDFAYAKILELKNKLNEVN